MWVGGLEKEKQGLGLWKSGTLQFVMVLPLELLKWYLSALIVCLVSITIDSAQSLPKAQESDFQMLL